MSQGWMWAVLRLPQLPKLGAVGVLTIPLISNEPINIGEKRLFEHELAEFFHERPQSRLLHGWNELIMHAALTEQGMCS